MMKLAGFMLLTGVLIHTSFAQPRSGYPVCSQGAAKLKCVPDVKELCKEKWDFENPCTPENLAGKKTRFAHPHDHTKYLMCDESSQLYIIQCPQFQTYNRKCKMCVDSKSPLPASCDVPLPPLVENPCTKENINASRLFFGFPGDLNKFIRCDAWGNARQKSCALGEIWNQYETACVDSRRMNPCLSHNADRTLLYQHPCNPVKYLQCDTFGDAYEITCPFGSSFNVVNQQCQPIDTSKGSGTESFCGGYVFSFRIYNYPASGGRVDLSLFTEKGSAGGSITGSTNTAHTSSKTATATMTAKKVSPFDTTRSGTNFFQGTSRDTSRAGVTDRDTGFISGARLDRGMEVGFVDTAKTVGQSDVATSRSETRGVKYQTRQKQSNLGGGANMNVGTRGGTEGGATIIARDFRGSTVVSGQRDVGMGQHSGIGVSMTGSKTVTSVSGQKRMDSGFEGVAGKTNMGGGTMVGGSTRGDSFVGTDMTGGQQDVTMSQGKNMGVKYQGKIVGNNMLGGTGMDAGSRGGNAGGVFRGTTVVGGQQGVGVGQHSGMRVSMTGSKTVSSVSSQKRMDGGFGGGATMDSGMGGGNMLHGNMASGSFVGTDMTGGKKDATMSQGKNMGIKYQGKKADNNMVGGTGMDAGSRGGNAGGDFTGTTVVGVQQGVGVGQHSGMRVSMTGSKTVSSVSSQKRMDGGFGSGATMDSGMGGGNMIDGSMRGDSFVGTDMTGGQQDVTMSQGKNKGVKYQGKIVGNNMLGGTGMDAGSRGGNAGGEFRGTTVVGGQQGVGMGQHSGIGVSMTGSKTVTSVSGQKRMDSGFEGVAGKTNMGGGTMVGGSTRGDSFVGTDMTGGQQDVTMSQGKNMGVKYQGQIADNKVMGGTGIDTGSRGGNSGGEFRGTTVVGGQQGVGVGQHSGMRVSMTGSKTVSSISSQTRMDGGFGGGATMDSGMGGGNMLHGNMASGSFVGTDMTGGQKDATMRQGKNMGVKYQDKKADNNMVGGTGMDAGSRGGNAGGDFTGTTVVGGQQGVRMGLHSGMRVSMTGSKTVSSVSSQKRMDGGFGGGATMESGMAGGNMIDGSMRGDSFVGTDMTGGQQDVTMSQGKNMGVKYQGKIVGNNMLGGTGMDAGSRGGNAGGEFRGTTVVGGQQGVGVGQHSGMRVSMTGSKTVSSVSSQKRMDGGFGGGATMDSGMGGGNMLHGNMASGSFVGTDMTGGKKDATMSQGKNMGVKYQGKKADNNMVGGTGMDAGSRGGNAGGDFTGTTVVGVQQGVGVGQHSGMRVSMTGSKTVSSVSSQKRMDGGFGSGATMDSGMGGGNMIDGSMRGDSFVGTDMTGGQQDVTMSQGKNKGVKYQGKIVGNNMLGGTGMDAGSRGGNAGGEFRGTTVVGGQQGVGMGQHSGMRVSMAGSKTVSSVGSPKRMDGGFGGGATMDSGMGGENMIDGSMRGDSFVGTDMTGGLQDVTMSRGKNMGVKYQGKIVGNNMLGGTGMNAGSRGGTTGGEFRGTTVVGGQQGVGAGQLSGMRVSMTGSKTVSSVSSQKRMDGGFGGGTTMDSGMGGENILHRNMASGSFVGTDMTGGQKDATVSQGKNMGLKYQGKKADNKVMGGTGMDAGSRGGNADGDFTGTTVVGGQQGVRMGQHSGMRVSIAGSKTVSSQKGMDGGSGGGATMDSGMGGGNMIDGSIRGDFFVGTDMTGGQQDITMSQGKNMGVKYQGKKADNKVMGGTGMDAGSRGGNAGGDFTGTTVVGGQQGVRMGQHSGMRVSIAGSKTVSSVSSQKRMDGGFGDGATMDSGMGGENMIDGSMRGDSFVGTDMTGGQQDVTMSQVKNMGVKYQGKIVGNNMLGGTEMNAGSRGENAGGEFRGTTVVGGQQGQHSGMRVSMAGNKTVSSVSGQSRIDSGFGGDAGMDSSMGVGNMIDGSMRVDSFVVSGMTGAQQDATMSRGKNMGVKAVSLGSMLRDIERKIRAKMNAGAGTRSGTSNSAHTGFSMDTRQGAVGSSDSSFGSGTNINVVRMGGSKTGVIMTHGTGTNTGLRGGSAKNTAVGGASTVTSMSGGDRMDTGFVGSAVGDAITGDGTFRDTRTGGSQQRSSMEVHFRSGEAQSSMSGETSMGTGKRGGAGMKHSSVGGKGKFVVFTDRSIGDQSSLFDSFFGSRNAAAGVSVDASQNKGTGAVSGGAGAQGAAHGQGIKGWVVTKDNVGSGKDTVVEATLTRYNGPVGTGSKSSIGGSTGDMTGRSFKTQKFTFKLGPSGKPVPGDASRLKALIQQFQKNVGKGFVFTKGGTERRGGGKVGGEGGMMLGEDTTLDDFMKIVGQATGGELTATVSSRSFHGNSAGGNTGQTHTVVATSSSTGDTARGSKTVVVHGSSTGGAADNGRKVVTKSSSTRDSAVGVKTVAVHGSSTGGAVAGGRKVVTKGLSTGGAHGSAKVIHHPGYEYRPTGKYIAPCTKENIEAKKLYHTFKGNRHKFIQCDLFGRMYLMPCQPTFYFDATDSICKAINK